MTFEKAKVDDIHNLKMIQKSNDAISISVVSLNINLIPTAKAEVKFDIKSHDVIVCILPESQ